MSYKVIGEIDFPNDDDNKIVIVKTHAAIGGVTTPIEVSANSNVIYVPRGEIVGLRQPHADIILGMRAADVYTQDHANAENALVAVLKEAADEIDRLRAKLAIVVAERDQANINLSTETELRKSADSRASTAEANAKAALEQVEALNAKLAAAQSEAGDAAKTKKTT